MSLLPMNSPATPILLVVHSFACYTRSMPQPASNMLLQVGGEHFCARVLGPTGRDVLPDYRINNLYNGRGQPVQLVDLIIRMGRIVPLAGITISVPVVATVPLDSDNLINVRHTALHLPRHDAEVGIREVEVLCGVQV